MTEEEWLTCDEVLQLLTLPTLATQPRKFRLFGCGCCRELGPWLSNPRAWAMVDAAERYADGLIQDNALGRWYREAERMRDSVSHPPGGHVVVSSIPEWIAARAVVYACTNNRYSIWTTVAQQTLSQNTALSPKTHPHLNRRFVDLLRDIFGNPFRPVAFDPRWRSESAVALARTAYDTRDFTLLPILADALEESGCDHADVLNHCRDPNGVHVRGCWVVDGVLGKQ